MTARQLVSAATAVAAMSVVLAAQAGRAASAPAGPDARTLSELATADLLVLVPRGGTTVFLAERTIIEALGARRGIVLSFAIFGRAVEDPLSHFLLGHVTEDELRLEANVSPVEWRRYKPLLDMAVARNWPIVPASGDGVSPEIERVVRAPDAGRRLAIHLAQPGTDPATLMTAARRQLAGKRVFSVVLADTGASHPAADYVLVP